MGSKKQRKKNKNKLFRYENEIIGIMLFGLGMLFALSFFYEKSVGIFGTFIKDFFLGLMGIPSFLFPSFILIYAIYIIFNKNDALFNRRMICMFILLLLISSTIHVIHWHFSKNYYENLSVLKYIITLYKSGKTLDSGGILGGIVSVPLLITFQITGTSIILGTIIIINILLIANVSIVNIFSIMKKRMYNMLKIIINYTKKLFVKSKNSDGDKNTELKLSSNKEQKKKDTKTDLNKYELEYSNFNRDEPVKFIMKDMKNKTKTLKDKRESNESQEIKVDLSSNPDYRFPPFELLNESSKNNTNMKTIKNKAMEDAKKLEETLNNFGVKAKVINISRGPTVTRYELQPSPGVKVSKIVNLSDDISLNLASMGVRIEAPIPGKAAIGIEVPNKNISPVLVKEVIQTDDFLDHPSKIAFALGKDLSGECIIADISNMPHLLIAGQTGAGKSVCINNLIISTLYKAAPDEVKLLLIDPKVVELTIYNGIPHLLIPVVTDPKKAAGALNWAVQEMVERYKLFAENSVKDIKGYNKVMTDNNQQKLPQIVIIIDELSDMMMASPNEVEDAICRLAQMARAAGMHLVIATQRPSVDVITGVIKANIPSRIAFAVSSQVDSRTILDMSGAEKLMGKGDMLFYPSGKSKPVRLQGALVTDSEITKIVEYVKKQADAEYDDSIIDEIETNKQKNKKDTEDYDELLPQVINMVVEAEQASVSMIQRKFRVGYARAARIVDQMEERGIVGGFEGSKPRKVLITKRELDELNMK